ncbi:hypothetical protein [Endozoicomonas atrinae]|uniref:hypothetical protein n=1 Tax=Endozoicomonas atrinae TaxID=1333660 RepID=UPI000825772E|nr:hypothetical protein [Endozoicomonas atrinae]
MEGVNPYTAGLQGRPVEGEHNTESSSHVRVLSPVSTKVAGKTKHQVSEVREKESFEISEVSKRNNSEQTSL